MITSRENLNDFLLLIFIKISFNSDGELTMLPGSSTFFAKEMGKDKFEKRRTNHIAVLFFIPRQ